MSNYLFYSSFATHIRDFFENLPYIIVSWGRKVVAQEGCLPSCEESPGSTGEGAG